MSMKARVSGFTSVTKTAFEAAEIDLGCVNDPTLRKRTPLISQENDYWCWAASAEMVEHFFDGQAEQCQIANAGCELKQQTCTGTECCQLPADCCVTPGSCLVAGWPPFEKLKIKFQRVQGPLSARQVVYELGCAKRPFVFSW